KGRQGVCSASRDLTTQISSFLFSVGVWHGFAFEDRPDIGERIYRLSWDYRKYPMVLDKVISRLRGKQLEVVKGASLRLTRNRDNHDWKGGYLHVLRSKTQVHAPTI